MMRNLLPKENVEKEVDYMQEHMIKSWIDSSNLWYQAKNDLKFIVDVSRTVDEMASGVASYLYWVHNNLWYKPQIM